MNSRCLRLVVMQQLLREETSGYTLAKIIHEETGWKPSFGSIYPLLERLAKDELVTIREEGRSKLYTLTDKGKQSYIEEREQQDKAYDAIIEQLRILASLGDEEANEAIAIINNVKEGNVPFKEIPETALVRQEMMRLLRENKLQANQKKLQTIFTQLHKELKAL